MNKTLLLGIDVGTSGAKAVVVSPAGRITGMAVAEYPLSVPEPLWAEQEPAHWWKAVVSATKKALQSAGVNGRDIAAVGLTGQMHGLVMLDDSGEVLRPAILWNDQRTALECREITEKAGARRVLKLTGNPVLPGFTAPKILWMRKHEPKIFRRAKKLLLPKDYIRYRLTGDYYTDVSDASGTSLFEVGRRRWSKKMLDVLDLDENLLPEVTESPTVSAEISRSAAKATGLAPGTPVVGGAGDQAAQAIGTGVIKEGVVSATLGTSGVVFAACDEYRVEPRGRLHAFCHAMPGKWHLMGVMLSAAGSFRWYRDTLGAEEIAEEKRSGRDAYDLLVKKAAKVPAGCEGLYFLPYLTGERTPHPDPLARGAFIGMTLRHGKAHMTRAVLEGISFGMNDSLSLMKELGVPLREVRASGGGAKSRFWRQMLADVFDAEITTVRVTEGAAFGAAILAAVGAGLYAGVEEAAGRMVKTSSKVEPGPDAKKYPACYAQYRELYPALKDVFAQIGEDGGSS